MTKTTFKHKESGKKYEVEKVINEYGLDIVIYIDKGYGYDKRKYARDLYKFLDNMELIKDSDES